MTKVRMINSVDEHPAGEEVDLPDEIADLFIVKGYAEGALSRDYDQSERAEILADQQVVSF
jgi:hypothetical protein